MAEAWPDFYVATMGAAAALSGLLIVAVSINLQRILEFKHLPSRAAEALLTLAGAMLTPGAGLIPQPPTALGVETCIIGAIVFIGSVAAQVSGFRALPNSPARWWISRAALTPFTGLPIAIGGALLVTGTSAGLYWIAAGVLLSLAAGVGTSWVLLVEIVR